MALPHDRPPSVYRGRADEEVQHVLEPDAPADVHHPSPPGLRVGPPLRSGLVRLASPRRELAEVHEDAARWGWPPGSWCE